MMQAALAKLDTPSQEIVSGEANQTLLSSKILAGEVTRLCAGLRALVESPTEQAAEKSQSKASQNDGGSSSGDREEGSDPEQDVGDSGDEEDAQPDPVVLQSALSKLGIPPDRPPPETPSSSSSDNSSVSFDDEGNVTDEIDDQASWESGSVDSQGNVRRGSTPSIASSTLASPPAKRSKKQPRPDANGTESRFLPSLATGFIRGDSDSSDIEDPDAPPARKNRRGQRARKA